MYEVNILKCSLLTKLVSLRKTIFQAFLLNLQAEVLTDFILDHLFKDVCIYHTALQGSILNTGLFTFQLNKDNVSL